MVMRITKIDLDTKGHHRYTATFHRDQFEILESLLEKARRHLPETEETTRLRCSLKNMHYHISHALRDENWAGHD